MTNVAVLNSDFTYIGMISWERSIVLLYQGKAETVKETDTTIYNTDRTHWFIIPRVIRLISFVKSLYKNKIPYSKRNIFVRDKHKCQYCGKKMTVSDCTVDHIVPKTLGGKSSWSNCVCSCKRCNNVKGDKPLEHTKMRLKSHPSQPTAADFIRLRSQHLIGQIENIWHNDY